MINARRPDSMVASDMPRYWAAKILFNGRPVTRREVLAILEAHRVPASYIAEFLRNAETLPVGDCEEAAAIPVASPVATARPEHPPADAAKLFDDLERQRNELMSRRSTC
jgi:hypothetical protein